MSEVKQRGGHRTMAKRLIVDLNNLFKHAAVDESEVTAIVADLNRHKDKILSYDDIIQLELEDDDLLNDMDESSKRIREIEKHLDIASKCIARMQTANLNISSISIPTPNHHIVKLPTLQLPTFGGNPLEWSHFWDVFDSSINSRTDLADVQKFSYLKGQLQNEALKLLDGFTITDINYQEALQLLKENYGEPKRIITAHLHALFDLKEPKINSKDLTSFRSAFESHIRGLKVLGTKIEEAGFIVCALLLRKLPSKIRDNLNRAAHNNYWELEEFRNAVTAEIRLLQSVEPDCVEALIPSKSYQSIIKSQYKSNPKFKPKFATKSTVGNFNINTSLNAKQIKTSNGKIPNERIISPNHCILCFMSNHVADTCLNYKQASDKVTRAKELKLCSNCLLNNHDNSNCWSKSVCKHCQSRHNTLLCLKTPNNKTTTVMATHSQNDNGNGIALPTAMLNIKSPKGSFKVRALFDQGSQRTFMLKAKAQQLNMRVVGEVKLIIDGFGLKGKLSNYEEVQFEVICNKDLILVKAILVDTLPSRVRMPGLKIAVNTLKQLGIKLADPNIKNDCISDVSLLIGSDQYFSFVYGNKLCNNIQLLTSKLGGMIVGQLPKSKLHDSDATNASVVTVLRIATTTEEDSVEADLTRLWSLDSIGISTTEMSNDDKHTLRDFEENLTYENGHYVASLPWRHDHPYLPSNYFLAKGRLVSVLRKLRMDDKSLNCYNDIIKDQLHRGFIEEVKPNEVNDKANTHYLAHHGVEKESITTPLRIVFDCSGGSPSLNDCLYSGPSMVSDLVQMLLKFRKHTYACVSDIEKAFLNISLHEKDRNFTRFLWPKNPFDIGSEIKTYRFKVVLFGATCSQFLLNAAIKHHLLNNPCPVAEAIASNLYIDNLQYNSNSKKELIDFYRSSKLLMNAAGLSLKEWTSNSLEFNELVKVNNDGIIPESDSIKVLGIEWNKILDTLTFPNKKLDSNAKTKRKVLSNIAKVFDPLGLLLPITVRGRILIQSLWKIKLSWDQEIPEEYHVEYQQIIKDVNLVREENFPRQIVYSDISIHAFCDASAKAFGSVIYFVDQSQSYLVIAKAKVAPIKTLTIPQLELTATTLSARLVSFVKEAYSNMQFGKIIMWTDSQVVLRWLESSKRLKPFIQNRVDEVKKLLPNIEWKYVPSKDNPSDLLSRGMTAKEFVKSNLWKSGPSWLNTSADWPVWSLDEENDEVLSGFAVINDYSSTFEPLFNITKFSKLKHIITITVLVLRFIQQLKGKLLNKPIIKSLLKGSDCNHHITISEITIAESLWIKSIQRECFNTEILYLKGDKKSKTPDLVFQLNLFIENDVIRCHGRLDNSQLSYDAKYPILLPNKHHYIALLIRETHDNNGHVGVSSMIGLLRQRWWWSRMRQTIKSNIRNCVICKKLLGNHYASPPTPPLPADRVMKSRPFSITGVDYTGALLVKNGKTINKVYIALFTCAVTRAVHLELVNDNSSESFLLAFRRFISRRSTPNCLYSDNANNFKAAAEHLKALQRDCFIQNYLIAHKVEWKFIPARSPWFGGYWERLIQLTKSTIKRILGKSFVTEDELRTVTAEVEMILNERPLTYVSDDLHDFQALSPSDLLYGHKLKGLITPLDLMDLDETYMERSILTRRQKRCATIMNHFWERWRKEYLTSLREYYSQKCANATIPIALGDIVLIKDEAPRMNWQLGRVTKLHQGNDGHIRSVDLKVKSGIISRSIVLLYPMELNCSDSGKDFALEKIREEIQRPKRAASIRARQIITQQLKE